MDIFFPMAGQGARFGHKFKPFLTIGEETFIEAAMRPFRAFADRVARFVFVYLEAQEAQFDVRRRLESMFTGLPVHTVALATPTRGPAETIARATERVGAGGAAFVCDCDHSLDVQPLFERAAAGGYDAILPVWPLAENELASWSVAMVEDGHVRAIAEKRMPTVRRGTAMGVIGCYGFRDMERVTSRAVASEATNFSDVLGPMLEEGGVVEAVRIEHARFFGDPERLAKETSSPL